MRSLACVLFGGVAALPEFGDMRVKELRTYLAERNERCFGCIEKHEFVAKASEVFGRPTPKSQPKPRPQPKTAPKTNKSKRQSTPARAITGDLASNIFATVSLLGVLVAGVVRCCSGCLRRVCYQRRRRADYACVFTLDSVVDPFTWGCCKQVCERKESAKWMQRSNLFRKRADGDVEHVALCPLCRAVQEPPVVRGMLGEFGMSVCAIEDCTTDYVAFRHSDSGIPDPAFARGESELENLMVLKTVETGDAAWQHFLGALAGDAAWQHFLEAFQLELREAAGRQAEPVVAVSESMEPLESLETAACTGDRGAAHCFESVDAERFESMFCTSVKGGDYGAADCFASVEAESFESMFRISSVHYVQSSESVRF